MKYALAAILAIASPLAFAVRRMPEFDIRTIIWNVLLLAGIAVIFGLLDYAIGKAPFISEPIKSFIHWGLIVVACLILIFLILGFLGL